MELVSTKLYMHAASLKTNNNTYSFKMGRLKGIIRNATENICPIIIKIATASGGLESKKAKLINLGSVS